MVTSPSLIAWVRNCCQFVSVGHQRVSVTTPALLVGWKKYDSQALGMLTGPNVALLRTARASCPPEFSS